MKFSKLIQKKQKKPSKKFKKPKGAIWIFFSYTTKDLKEFHIKGLAKALEKYDEYDQVLILKEKTTDSIIENMDFYIKNVNALVLFCSKSSKISEAVQNEWESAEAIGIPIIPVFKTTNHVPALLRAKNGVNFTKNPLQNTINKLHENLQRKIIK
ncbi:toll/interleukin-1 receptor domain-containing protein [Promethearchaeum syntrophicum]|uniref:Toll/interleukin-1 receptor domain-containing protein n=1 Tax=Promethearchaeum syntrophicum TaxID=2594042 RepID=A0A5B9D8C8_9ARCH|nr:toll/interleukin-1 receptor domain-containing protein [Candidatus Prometheoarchaeum syntrophicum]QEE15285.1 hypothetical protein DSAG12_01110 [Candidatus Prometheoarchaeum syntrophicum]